MNNHICRHIRNSKLYCPEVTHETDWYLIPINCNSSLKHQTKCFAYRQKHCLSTNWFFIQEMLKQSLWPAKHDWFLFNIELCRSGKRELITRLNWIILEKKKKPFYFLCFSVFNYLKIHIKQGSPFVRWFLVKPITTKAIKKTNINTCQMSILSLT